MPATILVPRELSLPLGFVHPYDLTVRSPVGEYHLMRVDHPATDTLRAGDPTLGWSGDPRLQMYCDHQADRWVLVRLEHDEKYRITLVSPEGALLSFDAINRIISDLQCWDRTALGHDLDKSVKDHNAKIEDSTRSVFRDKIENDIAPKMRSAVKRDLGAHF